MGILDLNNEENVKPELKAAMERVEKKAFEEEMFEGTFNGLLRDKLMELGKTENVPVEATIYRLGRVEFVYGNDTAVLQDHFEGPYVRHYTNMIDLQKPWWKKAFLEHACKGNMNAVGLIPPSVFEVVSKVGTPEAADIFNIENILNNIGVKEINPNAIAMGELIDYDMYSDRTDKQVQSLIEKMVSFWKKLAAPNFDIEFSTGGGDMLNKIRLVPLNTEAQDALMNGGKILDDVVKKIVDGYSDLIKKLKRVAGGKPNLKIV